MPVDSKGNVTTNKSVNVKTINDVMIEDKVDTIALKLGGMARTPQDTGAGVVLGGGGSYTLPAATTAALGGVKKTPAVAALAGGADAATIVTAFNDLVTKLRAAGVVT